ncbi:hypothetical protein WA026_010453 [Henosepilachna vigintioctopunctata]|uniref:Uncharacterized protein n=1 Tax=Henosepilachna vigintioctopunctata TaxID=420089 RepID=A0AAW1VD67_9CUCU
MILKVVLTFVCCMFILVCRVASTKCYVCGTENIKTCDNFDPNNSSYIMECPKTKSSCGLQTQGDIKIRTCEDLHMNDCQKANSIEYCYCTKDLCNGVSIFFTPSDDEDELEGSGSTTISSVTFTPTTTVTQTYAKGNQEMSTYSRCLISLLYLIPSVLK